MAVDLDLFVRLGVKDVDAFKAGLREAGSEVRRFRNETTRGGRRGRGGVVDDGDITGGGGRRRRRQDTGRELDRLGARVHHTGLALERSARRTGAALLSVVDPALEYDRAITDALAVTGDAAKGDNEAQLRGLSRSFADLGYSSRQVADSIKFMGMAGLGTEQIMGSMSSALNMAKAASVDAARAIDLGTDVMTSFGLPAGNTQEAMESMTRTADVLTYTWSNANTTLSLASQSLFKVGPLAKQAGVSIESTAAAVGVLAGAGIKGSESGTALRNMFLRLSRPTADVKDGFKKLKLDIDDVTDAIKNDDIAGAFKLIGDSARKAGLDEIEQLEVFGKIFGTRAATSAARLSGAAQSGELQAAIQGTRSSKGLTEQIAKTKLESDAAKVDKMRARLEEVGVTLGQKVLPQLLPVAEGFLEVAEGMADFARENPEMVRGLTKLLITFTAVGAVTGPVLTSFGSMIRLAGLMQTGFGAGGGLAGTMGGVVGATGKLGAALGKAGLVGAALSAGLAIGTAADQLFGISDKLAGVGETRDAKGDLLATTRGAAYLTKDENEQLAAARKKIEATAGYQDALSKAVGFAKDSGFSGTFAEDLKNGRVTGGSLWRMKSSGQFSEAELQALQTGPRSVAQADFDTLNKKLQDQARERAKRQHEENAAYFGERTGLIDEAEKKAASFREQASLAVTMGNKKHAGSLIQQAQEQERMAAELTRTTAQEAADRKYLGNLAEVDKRFVTTREKAEGIDPAGKEATSKFIQQLAKGFNLKVVVEDGRKVRVEHEVLPGQGMQAAGV